MSSWSEWNRFCIAGMVILVLALAVCGPAGAATIGRDVIITSTLQQRVVTTTTAASVCPAPYECISEADAQSKWGNGGYTQSSQNPCGQTPTVVAVIPYYCYRPKEVSNPQRLRTIPLVTTTVTYARLVTAPLVTTAYASVNKSLIAADTDKDGKVDIMDNCPELYNPGQEDYDQDGVGDDCDTCVHTANHEQEDADGDKIGDACDLCPNDKDPSIAGNLDDREAPGYADIDGDGIGDRCDPCKLLPDSNPEDHDGDGVGDNCDNCYSVKNPDQIDSDLDCASVPKYSSKYGGQAGGDPGGIYWIGYTTCGDACDQCPGVNDYAKGNCKDCSDSDGDGKATCIDTCKTVKNPDQNDTDQDGIGEACDNCPLNYNPEQWDTNNDGTGDACSCSWCPSTNIRTVYLSGDVSQSIDIILIPSSTAYDIDQAAKVQKDRYIKLETDFRTVVMDNIQNGFFMLHSYSTSPIKSDYKKKFNFYYYWDPASPADAHGTCGGTLPAGFEASVPFRDAAIILYPPADTQSGGEAIGGCSAGFGVPAQISAPGFWVPTLLHESGHGVFGLVDTYCSRPGIDTSYSQNDPYSNVWTSEANCKGAPASQYGNLNAASCRRIEADDPATPKNPDCSIDFWRWDPDPDDMRDCDFSSRFGKASVRRINYVFDSYGSP